MISNYFLTFALALALSIGIARSRPAEELPANDGELKRQNDGQPANDELERQNDGQPANDEELDRQEDDDETVSEVVAVKPEWNVIGDIVNGMDKPPADPVEEEEEEEDEEDDDDEEEEEEEAESRPPNDLESPYGYGCFGEAECWRDCIPEEDEANCEEDEDPLISKKCFVSLPDRCSRSNDAEDCIVAGEEPCAHAMTYGRISWIQIHYSNGAVF